MFFLTQLRSTFCAYERKFAFSEQIYFFYFQGQKRLIFKVWKKCTNAVLQPNMQTDLVLGFAALDLSVLSVGMPNVQGWFNIIDFSGKCNGQINVSSVFFLILNI